MQCGWRSMTDLRLTAYHEAGHAVMAQLCGQHVTEVEIIGDEEHSGSVQSLRFAEEHATGARSEHSHGAHRTAVLCIVAGMVAEAMVSGQRTWDESAEDLDVGGAAGHAGGRRLRTGSPLLEGGSRTHRRPAATKLAGGRGPRRRVDGAQAVDRRGGPSPPDASPRSVDSLR